MSKIPTSTELSNKHKKLKNEILLAIREHVGEQKIAIDMTDDANNPLFAVNKDDVFFNEDGVDCYPLQALSVSDALSILSIVEDLPKD